jgi:CBS domain-containing protein
MIVVELMKTHIVKISPDATLQDAVDMLDLYQLTSIPVIDSEGFPLGIITEQRISSKLIPPILEKSGHMAALITLDIAKNMRVSEIMSCPALIVDETADIREAATQMMENDLERLPVTTEGKVTGTISRIDVCQAILEYKI